MKSRLHSLILTNVRFYLRNGTVFWFFMLTVVIAGLSSFASVYTLNPDIKVSKTSQLLRIGCYSVYFISAVLATVSLSYSVNDDTMKMIVTKPCPHELFIASHFLSGLGLAVLGLLSVGIPCGLYTVWTGTPVLMGITVVVTDMLFRTVILFSILMTLSVVTGPLVSVVFVAIINPYVIHAIIEFLRTFQAIEKPATTTHGLNLLLDALIGLYYVLPVYFPFSDQFSEIYRTLRIESVTQYYRLGLTAGYALLVAFTCFTVLTFFLRSRRHV